MWRLAWRNLWRNRTRTLITLSAISLTLALWLVSAGIGDAMYASMHDAAERTAGGTILVNGEGYWAQQTSDHVLDGDVDALVATVAAVPGVEHVIPRVILNGLVSSPRGNAGVRITGVAPADQARLQDLSRHVIEGTFLVPGDDTASKRERNKKPIVLGSGVVSDLGLSLGDRVVVTATDASGEMVRALFHLTGVLETGSETMDSVLAFTTLAGAQAAVGMEGQLTQIGVLLSDRTARGATATGIAAAAKAAGHTVEVMTWDQAMPEMVSFTELDYRMNQVFFVVIFLVVCFGIANTFLMAVMERIRELGLLSALGLSPRKIAGLVMRETWLLALAGIALGLLFGYLGHAWIAANGIDIAALQGSDFEVSGVIMDDMVLRSRFNATKWGVGIVAVFVLVMISALYPAWRATRVDPATAMRTYA